MLAWQGCSGDEREMAKSVADIISKMEKPVIAEGQEPPEFWLALGGKSQYASSKRYQSCPYPWPPVPSQGEPHSHPVDPFQAAGGEPLCVPPAL